MKVRILGSARKDLAEGHAFYEEREQGLGTYFLDSLYSDIDSLAIYAGIHPFHFGHFHCMFSKRFPFGIYYVVDGDVAVVHAVLDCRREPAWIRKRLG